MTDPVAASLIILADRYSASCHHVQAIKCLKALCSLSLPTQLEAKARLKLAKLLWNHTYNHNDVYKELSKVNLLHAKLSAPEYVTLKVETFDLLAKYHWVLGDLPLHQEVCRSALQLWQQPMAEADSGALSVWVCHFYLQWASNAVRGERVRDAIEVVENGERFAAQLGPALQNEQLIFQLFRLQLQLLLWDDPAGSQEADQLLRQVHTALSARCSQGANAFTNQAQLHLRILQILLAIKKGTLVTDLQSSLTSSSQLPPFIADIEPYIALVKSQPPPYHWMPPNVQAALVYVLAAGILRPRGKSGLVKILLDRADNELEGGLQECGINAGSSGCSEERVKEQDAERVKLLLQLQLLVLEERAHLEIRECNLPAAQPLLLQAAQLLDSFPNLLRGLRPHFHLVLALYAQSAGQLAHAEAHCLAVTAVEELDPLHPLKVSAAALQAVAIISSGTPDASSRAIDVLGPLYSDRNLVLGHTEKAAAMYSVGLVYMAQGNHVEAKIHLRKALDKAHAQIGSNLHVSQVLNMMAPLYLQDRDLSGASSMISSSSALAKSAGDIFAQAGARISLVRHELMNANVAQPTNPALLLAKREEMMGRLRAAKATASGDGNQQRQHVNEIVLGWDL